MSALTLNSTHWPKAKSNMFIYEPTLRMKPSGQVSWSYHMALYMSRRSRLVRKAKVMRIRPVIWATTHTNTHLDMYNTSATQNAVVQCTGKTGNMLFVVLLSINSMKRPKNCLIVCHIGSYWVCKSLKGLTNTNFLFLIKQLRIVVFSRCYYNRRIQWIGGELLSAVDCN